MWSPLLSCFHLPSHHCWPHPIKSRFFLGTILLLFHGNLLEVSTDGFRGSRGSCWAPVAQRPLTIYVCFQRFPRLETLDGMRCWIFCSVGSANTAETNICVVRVGRRDSAEAHVHRLVHSRAHSWCRSLVGLFVRFISWQQGDCPHRHIWRIIVQFSVDPSPQTPSH